MPHVLVVDDEPGFTTGISDYLRLKKHSVVTADSLAAAREMLNQRVPDVLFLDLMLPDGNGLELFEQFSDRRPSKIVLITGHNEIKSLIGEMAGDGVSFVKKPVDPAELLSLIDSPAAGSSADDDTDAGHFGNMVGESAAMQAIYKQISQVAKTDSTVFVQGESGTGKELVADALHKMSHKKGPFVPVNCGALSKDLLSTQLFGHEKGSFTGANKRHTGFFERANFGTLFLDEITEMPVEMQTHLLRVLETGKVLRVGGEEEIPVSARLIVATNRDPAAAIRDGVLREDLYFRLSVFPIHLPPLRERDGDIELLASYFLDSLNRKNGTKKSFADDSMALLGRHEWPGNVRELKHLVDRSYILAEDDKVVIPSPADVQTANRVEGLRPGRSIADVEKDLIIATLNHFDGNKKATAKSLGISLKTLYNRISDYGGEDIL